MMSEALGRCPLCGGEKRPGKTTFAVDLKFGVVVVRGVPALICMQCGEDWIEEPVAEQLEKLVTRARTRKIEIEVAQWEQVAA